MTYKEYTHNNKVYREIDFPNYRMSASVDFQFVNQELRIDVSNIIDMHDEICSIELTKEQTLEVIKMLTDSLDQVKD